MKISWLRTSWIVFLSSFYTLNACIRSIYRSWSGTMNRPWVDLTIHRWVNHLLRLVKVSYTIVNPKNTEPQLGQATIMMVNHSSAYDIPLSFKAFPNHSIRMLAKKEISRIPVMGQGMSAAEFPFIDRKNRHQAIKDLNYARELMESGVVMWICPEGTRSKDGRLAPFKKGGFITAIQAKAIIIPVGIRGAYEILPAKTHCFNINQCAEIHIGEAIDAAQYSLAEKEILLERVHTSIKQLIGQ